MIINEDWYSDVQIAELGKIVESVKGLQGLFIEIGCWEGKSTIKIANTLYPMILHAVDTWEGNINEDPNHITVKTLKIRDVFSVFKQNIQTDTQGNIKIFKMDCFDYLEKVNEPITLCHIDASHNYEDVKKTIEMALPFVIKGGVLCGDDISSANINRTDLNGGVERAVKELLPGYTQIGNFWYWRKNA